MIIQLKRFKIQCDKYNCPNTLIVDATTEWDAKDQVIKLGWKEISIGPCGLTDYYKDNLCCPECAKTEKQE